MLTRFINPDATGINIEVIFFYPIMTHNEYENLNEAEQIDVLFNHGIHISDRADNKYCMILFQIDNFYVELYYHLEHDTLKKLKSFRNLKYIEPYLDQIDLSELMIEIM